MTSPSNLYAEKIYAEQPIALWSLDDDCTFVSYLPDASLDLTTWTGATLVGLADNEDPFPKILNSSFVSIESSGLIDIVSPTSISSSSNFSAGIWVNPQVELVQVTFSLGSYTKSFDMVGIVDKWIYLEHTFEVTSAITSEDFIISFNYGASTGKVYLNGFSVGVNQEFFGSVATGNQLSAITGSSFSGYGVTAYEYGLGQNNGWYVGDNTSKKIYAKNFSMPLVYGARSSTVLYENPSGPSLILPGMGFLNESGRHNTISFEAWIRVKTDGSTQQNPFRIIGPISSTDGLYVNGQHLILKVDGKTASHYVGEWFRPMLVNIEYMEESVTLFVNGENVCSIDVSAQDFSLPADGQDDYIGFYAGGNIQFLEVDCVAIYPYRMSPAMLKRRFGYGQAVQVPSEIETGYSGKQIAIDYTFAGYSSDYSYPNVESWSSSIKDNTYTTASIMGSPRQSLPSVIISNPDMSKDSWVLDNSPGPYIKMIPSAAWESENVYLFMEKLRQDGMLPVSSIYLYGKANSDYADRDQVLLRLQNKNTLDSISVILSGTDIYYVYNVFGTQGTLATKSIATTSSDFSVGLDFASISSQPSEVVRFLASVDKLSLFIGGDYSGTDQGISTNFGGTIYSFGITSNNNFIKNGMSSLFTDGIANPTANFSSVNPSYGVEALVEDFSGDTIYSIETSASSYWQDYIPLSKFAKQADNGEYVSDMLQISIDSPSSTSVVSGNLDTSDVDVRTFVYFVNNSQIENLSSFGEDASLALVSQPISSNLVVDASSWQNKKFEVVDGVVIYLPQSTLSYSQSDLSMVTLVEMHTRSSSKYPIKIRSIEYAAQTFSRQTSSAFDKTLAKKIGARSASASAYMFSESGGQFVYNGYNPLSISKNSTPYLYLTNKTGIKVLDSYGSGQDRGVYVPINESAAETVLISLISMSILYSDKEFVDGMSIAEFYGKNYTNKLRLAAYKVSNNSSQAYLYVEHYNGSTWDVLDNVKIYVNGNYMAKASILAGEWATVGVYFSSNSLDASGVADKKIEIVGSCVVNNISYYQLRPEELAQQLLTNEWNDAYQSGAGLWSDITTENWSVVYATESFVEPSLTPDTIFNIYTGTNKILSIESSDFSGIGFNAYRYDILENVVWQPAITIS